VISSYKKTMVLLRFLRGRGRGADPGAEALLPRIASRVPADGAPGLLPAADPTEAEEEERLGARFAAELHRLSRGDPSWLGQGRRLAAIASAARRRSAAELEEALRGVPPWELGDLAHAVASRKDLTAEALAETARALAKRARDFQTLAGAIAFLGKGIEGEDRELILRAGRSPALAGICALALENLPDEEADASLLELASRSEGMSRALVLERLAARHLVDPDGFTAYVPRALELAAAIEDPLVRAWGAVPLIEVARLPARLDAEPELALPAARCLEAISRGGWNGGPGPGIGRLPGATHTAEAILQLEGMDPEARRITARAVVDARPVPPGPAHAAAEKLLAEG